MPEPTKPSPATLELAERIQNRLAHLLIAPLSTDELKSIATLITEHERDLVEALEEMSELCGNYFDESQLICARDKEIWTRHLQVLSRHQPVKE